MVTRRGLPATDCRWLQTASKDLPDRWQACLQGSTGHTTNTDAQWVATAATDTPFFPADFVTRMLDGITAGGADMACAASAGRHHPVFGLWPVRLAADLRHALADEGIRKVDLWTARHKLVAVEFAADPHDPFFNVNRPEDVEEAERIAAGIAA
jgi:molybdopterin-guanine dinucleotide biosynthesis protein A